MTPLSSRATRRTSGALLGCALLAALSACSGDDAPSARPAPGEPSVESSASAAPTEPDPVMTSASIDRVDGDLDERARTRVRLGVTSAVDAWIDGAYGGDYPHDDFPAAFDTFTAGARARAEDDAALMTNEAVGPMLEEVRAVRRRLKIDVLGVDGAAVAVTARVAITLALRGEITRTDAISGSLFLTLDDTADTPGWRVFGYDLTREEV